MATKNLNDDYGVTITYSREGKGYIATGELFLRKTMKNIGVSVTGEGRTKGAAWNDAVQKATAKCP